MYHKKFTLHAPYEPAGDQAQAMAALSRGIETGKEHQVLLGVTGSGKTYTMAKVIEATQRPTLVIAHNKTLAAQLYQEFRDFFPDNAVSYFVSYYDYYQPEAYIPSTDTYIEKEATINDEIDKLRLATTTNLLTRSDVIIVASVSAIYNLGSPIEYGSQTLELVEGEIIPRKSLLLQLSNLQYERSDADLRRGTYRVRGDTIQLWPAYESVALKLELAGDSIEHIAWIDPITGTTTKPDKVITTGAASRFTIFPAKHYLAGVKDQTAALQTIEQDLALQIAALKKQERLVEAYRLQQKVTYDLDMIREFGFTNGIENYSRYFDGRKPGQPPFTLLDYFSENVRRQKIKTFLTLVDESHITLPQIGGMHRGDRARKETLIQFGFRLPSALDNRPLDLPEFQERTPQNIYISATPGKIELGLTQNKIVEQVVRPTGLLDPVIQLRPSQGQIENLVLEILSRKLRKERVLVTTLTKRMAEALTEFLNTPAKVYNLVAAHNKKKQEQTADTPLIRYDSVPTNKLEIGPIPSHLHSSTEVGELSPTDDELPKVAYLHSDIETLERSDILDDLRKGVYDVLVGINLLREGLDLPEVSLVAILDADKEGFLRSVTSLVQTMGRAARHEQGSVLLYADRMTKSMRQAIEETTRRRELQLAFNQKHNITPAGVQKPIKQRMLPKLAPQGKKQKEAEKRKRESSEYSLQDIESLTPLDRKKYAKHLRKKMQQAVKSMAFEQAAEIRDILVTLETGK
ncbi:MAG: excinuclease ABC subunit UvrB [Candidatus Pacebacteria bacterium]|nr:excinuclease ABC subunit UvrB [Candidatus Paceibacterota bacterium]PIR60173.1 MAG: excinuclease ABC subunit B [Candidatus Pacebacteria bacterium CG10_big_fil_rev_8_21_14_0_10_44_54]